MGVELPIVCQSLYAKSSYFTLVNDSLEVRPKAKLAYTLSNAHQCFATGDTQY